MTRYALVACLCVLTVWGQTLILLACARLALAKQAAASGNPPPQLIGALSAVACLRVRSIEGALHH